MKIAVEFELSEEEMESLEFCMKEINDDMGSFVKQTVLVLTGIMEEKPRRPSFWYKRPKDLPVGEPYDPAIFA
ncbi:MAG: hypothetical protein LBG57_09610 [Treponema sp.]|jgi:hypothetical protein|nr:hypothetical protein [Treponema sp.]